MKTDDLFDQRDEIEDDIVMTFEMMFFDAIMNRMSEKWDLWEFG